MEFQTVRDGRKLRLGTPLYPQACESVFGPPGGVSLPLHQRVNYTVTRGCYPAPWVPRGGPGARTWAKPLASRPTTSLPET